MSFQRKIPLYILLFFFLSNVHNAFSSNFYLRSDAKTTNGIISETNLLMVPANEDFRIKNFIFYKITGQAKVNSTIDILSTAKHNAFSNLLLKKGVKSIKNKSERNNLNQYEESVLSYEGFIKSNYLITKQSYNSNNTVLNVEIEVWFSPIAYPTEWSFYYFKKKLYDSIQNVISVFK